MLVEGFRLECSNPCFSNKDVAIFTSGSLHISYFRRGPKIRPHLDLYVFEVHNFDRGCFCHNRILTFYVGHPSSEVYSYSRVCSSVLLVSEF